MEDKASEQTASRWISRLRALQRHGPKFQLSSVDSHRGLGRKPNSGPTKHKEATFSQGPALFTVCKARFKLSVLFCLAGLEIQVAAQSAKATRPEFGENRSLLSFAALHAKSQLRSILDKGLLQFGPAWEPRRGKGGSLSQRVYKYTIIPVNRYNIRWYNYSINLL